MEEWSLYIIRCNDGSLYTGISTNVDRRLGQHRKGKGSKYLKGRSPLELVFKTEVGSHSDALKAEAIVKKMKKEEKEAIISEISNLKLF